MLICPVCQTKYEESDRQRCSSDSTPLEEFKPVSPPTTPANDQIIAGRYRIIKQLGVGGMAIVYLVERLNIGDLAALKVMNRVIAADPEALSRFELEARLAASASHPNVVQIYDFGVTEDKLPYLVMEFLEGPTLSEELRRSGTLSLERALEIFQPVCAAVTSAHAGGLIHRDLKPSNIILQQLKGGSEFVKVVDFGIAKTVANHPIESDVTNKGEVVGTLGYMPLEQVRGEDLDHRADIYSLGVIFYELLTGQIPFNAASTAQMLVAMAKERPRSLKSLRPDIPTRIELSIFKALSKDRNDRHNSANEFVQELIDAANRARPIFVAKTKEAEVDTPAIDPLTQKIYQSTGDVAVTRWRGTIGTLNLDLCLGRDRELELLRDNFLQMAQGKALPSFIHSDPGVGRSQLLYEYQKWAEAQGAVVLPARFYDYGGSQLAPYQVFLDLLRACLLGQKMPPITQRISNDTKKHSSAGETSQLAEMIQSQTGVTIPGEAFSPEALAGTADKWRVFEAVTEIYKRIARSSPVVFLFDDLHFADSLSLEMLAYIIRNTNSMRVQVVATALTEDMKLAGKPLRDWLTKQLGHGSYREINLSGLPRTEAEGLLAAIFGKLDISDEGIDYIWKETQGFPLYLTELLEHLMITNKIERVGDHWRANWFGQLDVTPSVNSLVDARLRRFGPEALEIFKHAAVIGDEFQFEVLAEVMNIDEDALDEILREGVAGWIIKEQQSALGDFFRFHHSMLRRALYNSMSKSNRRKVHAQVAESLEGMQMGKKDRLIGQVAYHYYWAGEWAATFNPAVKAGEMARKREAFAEAVTYFHYGSEAFEQLEAEGEKVNLSQAGKLKIGLAESLIILNRFDEADKAIAQIFELASRQQDAQLRAWGELMASRLSQSRGAVKRATELAQLGLESITLVASVDKELHRRLLQQRGYTLWMSGQQDAAIEPLEQAVQVAEAAGDKRPGGWALSWLGIMQCFRGNGHRGLELAEEGLKLLRASGDRVSEVFAWERVGIICSMLGDQDRAIYFFEHGLELARTIGHKHQQALMYVDLGEANRLKNNLIAAEQHYQQALTISRQIDRPDVEALSKQNLGLVAIGREQYQAAVELMTQALKLFQEQHRGISEAEVYWALGKAKQELGLLDAALDSYQQATLLCQKLSYSDYEWKSLLGQGQLFIALQRPVEAQQVLDQAITVIEQMRKQLPEGANLKVFQEDKQVVYDLMTQLQVTN